MALTASQVLSMPLGIIAEDFYLPEKRKRRQPNTVYGYESSIRLHVLPRWDAVEIGAITRDDVQEWVDSFPKDNPGGAEKAFKCLRQIIRWTMDKWTIFMADPTRGVELPRKPTYKPETLTERRLKRLIRGLVGCAYEATAIIQTALGCRMSENEYLHWEWINWRTGFVPLRGSLHQVPGLVYESATKTPKGERDGFLPPWALDRLHAIWVKLGRPKGRIIGMAKPSKVRYHIKKWVKKARLPWVGFRNLRHTWGTIAAKSSPIEAVSAMMGHSNIQTTYRYYYSITKSTMRRVQRKVARSILGKTCDDMYRGVIIPMPEALPMAA